MFFLPVFAAFFALFALSDAFLFPMPPAPAAPKCCCPSAPPPPPPCGCGGRKKREITNDLKCNSKLLLTIIDESLTHDITETMAMLKARLHDDKGRKHTVICTPTSQTFEFSMENDSVFCSSGNDDVTCYVFADGAHPSGVIFK